MLITRMKFFLMYLFFPFDLEKCGGWQEMGVEHRDGVR